MVNFLFFGPNISLGLEHGGFAPCDWLAPKGFTSKSWSTLQITMGDFTRLYTSSIQNRLAEQIEPEVATSYMAHAF